MDTEMSMTIKMGQYRIRDCPNAQLQAISIANQLCNQTSNLQMCLVGGSHIQTGDITVNFNGVINRVKRYRCITMGARHLRIYLCDDRLGLVAASVASTDTPREQLPCRSGGDT